MAPTLSLLPDGPVFDPEAIHAMSTAFDAVCIALGLPDASRRDRDVIATRIIELARRGERSADQLRDRVLREAGSLDGEPTDTVWAPVAE
jgi:hypothetical protein